jgi:hypothetical protein
MLAMVRFTVFSSSFLSDVLNDSQYYTDLCDEMTDDMVDIGNASGLDKSFFDDFVDEVMVRQDVQAYIESFYKGDKLTVDTTNFEKALRTALNTYQKENGIDKSKVSKDSINYFVEETSKIYSDNIEITYFSAIQKTVTKWAPKLLMYTVILGVAVLVILVFIFFTNKWKHLAIKYFYYATSSSGLFILIVPTVLLASGLLQKVAILNRSLNDLYTAFINTILTDMYIIGGILVVLSVILVVIHNQLRKKAMG